MTALCTTLPDNLRLLLVDDHRIFLDGLSMALSPLSQNLQIHTAYSAAEAEQCLRQHDYDLVLLDLRLPDEPGIELLQRGVLVTGVDQPQQVPDPRRVVVLVEGRQQFVGIFVIGTVVGHRRGFHGVMPRILPPRARWRKPQRVSLRPEAGHGGPPANPRT